MLKQNHIESLIIRYLENTISETDLLTLNHWIQESNENKMLFYQLKEVYDDVHPFYQPDAKEKEASWERMYTKIKGEEKKEQPLFRVKRLPIQLLKYAAIILLLGGVGILFVKQNVTTTDEVIAYNEIRVEKGGKPNTLILSDGSIVRLNAETTLKYPSHFSKESRNVYLDGEAYFEITPDSLKPFIVNLKQQHITVLGTSFNVEAYGDKPYSITTLLSGRILLESYDRQGQIIGKVFLKPGQKAHTDNETGAVSLENIEVTLSNTWINGIYKFKDEPLFSIVNRLEKYYGVYIYLEDDSLQKIKYTGTFSLDQDIQEVLEIINYEKHFRFTRTGNEIYIKK